MAANVVGRGGVNEWKEIRKLYRNHENNKIGTNLYRWNKQKDDSRRYSIYDGNGRNIQSKSNAGMPIAMHTSLLKYWVQCNHLDPEEDTKK